MKRLDHPEDGQTRAYVVKYDIGGFKTCWKVWRPDFTPHLSVLVWEKKSDAEKSAARINKTLERIGFK